MPMPIRTARRFPSGRTPLLTTSSLHQHGAMAAVIRSEMQRSDYPNRQSWLVCPRWLMSYTSHVPARGLAHPGLAVVDI